jgi:hypothetical protein
MNSGLGPPAALRARIQRGEEQVAVGTLLDALDRVGNGFVVGRDPLLMSTHLPLPDSSATCLNTLMI